MIPQHELFRVWVEIDLIANVSDVEDLDVMLDQRERDDQRRKPPMIVVEHAQQLGLFMSGQSILEVAQNVLQYIDMFPDRRLYGQRFHEELSVLHGQFPRSVPLRLTDQPPQLLVMRPAVREKQILMDGVKPYDSLSRDAVPHKILEASVTEYPFDEVLSEPGIAEPSFLLDGNQRKLFDKGLREQADAIPAGHPMLIVDADSLDAAARRIFLEYVPGEIQIVEFLEPLRGHRH